MDQNDKHFYDFGPFRLNVTQRVLIREGRQVPLGAKAFQTLLVLVENRGRVVKRDELLSKVWPRTSVDENSLSQQIRNLRRALGDNGRAAATQYIQTISGEGYSFIADIAERRGTVETTALKPPPTQVWTPELRLPKQHPVAWVVVTIGVLVGLVAWLVTGRLRPSQIQASIRVGRVLVRSTSEGRSPTRIRLSHPAVSLALSPDGGKLFATSSLTGDSRTLSIVNTVSGTVRTVVLPADANTLAFSPDGKLFIGSQVDGVMVFDTTKDQLVPGLIPTHGPVLDLAVTPDGKKLFLAMSHFGVKRLQIKTGELKQITDQVCPEYLTLDPLGRRLYVSYQCGGPGGRPGHDSVEIFDAEKEESLGLFSGPPIVGGYPSVSPDGRLLTMDGIDACYTPAYDHIGCPLVPSHRYYLFRSGDLRVLRTFPRPVTSGGPARFIDRSRFVVAGDEVTVIDATSGAIRENWEHGLGGYYMAVPTPDGRRVFLGGDHDMLVLEVEDQACSPPQEGLAQFYSGDGTMDDAAGVTELIPRGDVSFARGKIGQAFFFNGNAFMDGPRTAHYVFGVQDSTLALYVKFASLHGEMTVLERMAAGKAGGFALLKSDDNRFLFEVATANGLLTLASKKRAVENRWYHLAIAKTDQGIAFYIDGDLEAQHPFDSPPDFLVGGDRSGSLHYGAREGGRAPLYGWLDEIAFYDRALLPGAVKALYQLRESGPCRL